MEIYIVILSVQGFADIPEDKIIYVDTDISRVDEYIHSIKLNSNEEIYVCKTKKLPAEKEDIVDVF